MKYTVIALGLCAYLWAAHADLVHLKAAKAKLLGGLAVKAKHHKRGILSSVPSFKLGYDIPLVSHSVVKPLVVTYPPTAAVATVKVPLTNPLVPRYPLPVGHRVPVPHPHYGLKFPHSTKSLVVTKPDHQFHHHHHHIPLKPAVPLTPAAPVPVPIPAPSPVPLPVPAPAPIPIPAVPFLPIPQPATAVRHTASPVLFQTSPAVPVPPAPIASPPLHLLPPNHIHLKPLLPAAVPIQPAPVLPSPLFQYAHQFPYVLRHGGALQTSIFATYPRYPLLNYQSPLLPIAPSASGGQAVGQVLFNRPHVSLERPQVLLQRPQVPQFHLLPQDGVQGSVVEHATNVPVAPSPTLLHPTQSVLPTTTVHLQAATIPQPAVHLQPTQPATTLDHEGWSPVTTQSRDIAPTHNPEVHFPYSQTHHHFTQEQGTQVYEHHTGDGQYHDLHDQLQHHIQQQIDQAQYEQHLNSQHQLLHQYASSQQPGQEYSVPNHDFTQQSKDFLYHGQEYAPRDQQYIPNDQQYSQNDQNFQQYVTQDQQFVQHGQQFGHRDQQYIQQDQQFGQNDHQFGQHDHQFGQHDQQFGQHDQQYGQHDQQFGQNDHQIGQHDQQFGQHDQQLEQHDQQFSQHDQQFLQHAHDLGQQPAQDYGAPQQGVEGRNDGQETDQQYHNHIPLGLQPPIDEPLDHFR